MFSPALIQQLDFGIDVLFAEPDAAISNVDATVAELLGVAADLRTLPRPDFRSQLRVRLMESALASSPLSGREVMASAVIAGRSFPQPPANSAGGGGGGGDHDKLQASQGHLPKKSLEQFAPAEVVIRNDHAKLIAEATVVVPLQVNSPDKRLPNLGNPRSAVAGPPSNGIG